MYELKKKKGKVFTSKFVGTGPSSCEKRIYRAAVSQRLRNTVLDGACFYLWTVLLFLGSSLRIEHITSRALPSSLPLKHLFRSR